MAKELSWQEHRKGRNQLVAFLENSREALSRSPESGAWFGFLSVLLFFFVATWIDTGWPPQIVDSRSIASITSNAASQGIIAIGVTMLMISGEFDLSVGSMLGLSALMFILAADSGPGSLVELIPGISTERVESWGISYGGMHGLLAILVALITGAALGWLNGVIRVWTRIPSFIVTLGTLYFYRSVMLNIIPGGTIARYERDPMIWSFEPLVVIGLVILGMVGIGVFLWPTTRRRWAQFQDPDKNGLFMAGFNLITILAVEIVVLAVGLAICFGYADQIGDPINAPFFSILNGQLGFVEENFMSSLIWWLLLAVVFTIVLNHTKFGNAVFATGGNPEAARAQGINVNRVKIMTFVLSGLLAAVGGITEAARFKVVEPLRGTGYELDVIAATVIGGTLLTGGYGSIFGTVLGILIAFMLKTGLVLIGVEAAWFRGILGVIMIIAVIINTNIRRQR